MPLCHATADFVFITDDDANIFFQKFNIFLLIMDSSGGITAS